MSHVKIAIYLVMVVLLFGLIALPITTSRMREIKIPEPPPYQNTTQNYTTANNTTTTDEYPIPRETEGVNDNTPIIYAFLISILLISVFIMLGSHKSYFP